MKFMIALCRSLIVLIAQNCRWSKPLYKRKTNETESSLMQHNNRTFLCHFFDRKQTLLIFCPVAESVHICQKLISHSKIFKLPPVFFWQLAVKAACLGTRMLCHRRPNGHGKYQCWCAAALFHRTPHGVRRRPQTTVFITAAGLLKTGAHPCFIDMITAWIVLEGPAELKECLTCVTHPCYVSGLLTKPPVTGFPRFCNHPVPSQCRTSQLALLQN